MLSGVWLLPLESPGCGGAQALLRSSLGTGGTSGSTARGSCSHLGRRPVWESQASDKGLSLHVNVSCRAWLH